MCSIQVFCADILRDRFAYIHKTCFSSGRCWRLLLMKIRTRANK
ncbi:hypothetical protein CSC17_5045 [Klebsiella oxytoca]|nr:hypothetical protein CSC17_5045 [Klebsiella oxytoca]